MNLAVEIPAVQAQVGVGTMLVAVTQAMVETEEAMVEVVVAAVVVAEIKQIKINISTANEATDGILNLQIFYSIIKVDKRFTAEWLRD